MIKVDQQELHDPDNDKIGDCYRACIASVLEMDINNVPHFARHHADEWYNATIEWAYKHGYAITVTDEYLDVFKYHYAIVGGRSPRSKSISHAVIYKGNELVHDPHPDKTGIYGDPMDYLYFIKIL